MAVNTEQTIHFMWRVHIHHVVMLQETKLWQIHINFSNKKLSYRWQTTWRNYATCNVVDPLTTPSPCVSLHQIWSF